MESPLVTVVCLCYNHAGFVRESIASVFSQTHPRVQLIVVDDASTDASVHVIREALEQHPSVTFLALQENLGNCRAFNKGWERAAGDFIIDLAADDVLLPERISEGIRELERNGTEYGVHFSDAELINEKNDRIGFHSERFPHASIPQGDIYKNVIGRYFINSPTMMMRRSVMTKLGGYDESLAYEDFDFWIRSAREFYYCYSPLPLIRRRILSNSMSQRQYMHNSLQLRSTYVVCEKINKLNRDDTERMVLRKRIRYEMRKALMLGEFALVWRYSRLYLKS